LKLEVQPFRAKVCGFIENGNEASSFDKLLKKQVEEKGENL
jgi:hypothetical protein